MIKCVEYKLYLNSAQERCLSRWLRVCCWIYNRALDQRIKSYKRRKQSVNYSAQQKMLTVWRGRMENLRACPAQFERDALRRVDRGFKAFFRRCKSGDKPGFPRFHSHHRYNSIEQLAPATYSEDGRRIYIPGMGKVCSRGPELPGGKQKGVRVIRRASGWYAQIIIDDCKVAPDKRPIESAVGLDMGVNSFAASSDGEHIENPRWARTSQRKLTNLSRRLARRKKGSARRRRALKALQHHHERVAAQRKSFCHEHTTRLVRKYDLIAVEKLQVRNMVRSRFARSILDCGWSIFKQQLAYKAECAGRTLVEVDPRNTSRECPACGAVKPKELSERQHECPCGCHGDRDVIAAQVILARALVVAGAERPSSLGLYVGACSDGVSRDVEAER